MVFSYNIMHSCWSPVPKCRPSFQQLVFRLEALWLGLSPTPLSKEPLLYVNLEGEEQEVDRYAGGARGPQEMASWGVPWQHEVEEEVKHWLTGESGAAQASGGDYRYIINPSEEEEGGARTDSIDTMEEDDDDVVIHV